MILNWLTSTGFFAADNSYDNDGGHLMQSSELTDREIEYAPLPLSYVMSNEVMIRNIMLANIEARGMQEPVDEPDDNLSTDTISFSYIYDDASALTEFSQQQSPVAEELAITDRADAVMPMIQDHVDNISKMHATYFHDSNVQGNKFKEALRNQFELFGVTSDLLQGEVVPENISEQFMYGDALKYLLKMKHFSASDALSELRGLDEKQLSEIWRGKSREEVLKEINAIPRV